MKKAAVVTPEAVVLRGCKQLLHVLQSRGVLLYRRIHTAGIVAGPGRFRPNTDMEGMTDLQVYLHRGVVLHIEVKRTRGKLSPRQNEWRESLEKIGHKFYSVDSVDRLIQVLEENGVTVGSRYPGPDKGEE